MTWNFPTLKKYNFRRCDNARYYMDNYKFRITRSNNPLNSVYRGIWANKCTDRIGYKILKQKCLC